MPLHSALRERETHPNRFENGRWCRSNMRFALATRTSSSNGLQSDSKLHYDHNMKRFFGIALLIFFALGPLVKADGPDAQYVKIYNLISEADQAGSSGQPDLAREKYVQAQNELKKLKDGYPNWSEKVVQFRIEYVNDKLKNLPAGKNSPAPAKSAPSPARTTGDARDRQIQSLTEEVHQLQQDKTVLESKLKEAISARPAASDPRELAKAEERIKMLEKEKELLRVSLEQEQAKQNKPADSSLVDELRKALADANKKLSEQSEKAVQLAREKEILETRLQSARKDTDEAKSLRVENDLLKKRLGDGKPVTEMNLSVNAPQNQPGKSAAPGQTNDAEVVRLQGALQTLAAEKAILEQAKKDLETKLASLTSSGVKPITAEGERLRQVEKERDDLLKKLNDTSRQIYDNKATTETVRKEQSDNEMKILRARLEVFEARAVPYTAEEKALFEKPQATMAKADPKGSKKPTREPPRGAGLIESDAERAFLSKRYDEAEKKYQQMLRLDEKNVFTLSNLAACQLEQSHFDEAESNLKRALQYDSEDPHSLYVYGILKFRQEKFDEALDFLSRSAQFDPQNPETQNYLGITLSQKGQRGPAETALRKAVQLAPNYGGAHLNLAVVYATQQPPFVELARWHYQKALASGHPQNLELEKLIEGNGATAAKK